MSNLDAEELGPRVPPTKFMRRLELPVKGGPVVFTWPDPMEPEDIKDVHELLRITLAAIERRSVADLKTVRSIENAKDEIK